MAQVKIGKVVSNKMKKTVVVEIETAMKHPLYKKRIKRSSRIKAHDEIGVQVGQKVKIFETRPLAGDVHFKIKEVVE